MTMQTGFSEQNGPCSYTVYYTRRGVVTMKPRKNRGLTWHLILIAEKYECRNTGPDHEHERHRAGIANGARFSPPPPPRSKVGRHPIRGRGSLFSRAPCFDVHRLRERPQPCRSLIHESH